MDLTPVKVEGLGELPAHFSVTTDQIDLTLPKDANGGINRHNEKGIKVACEEEAWGINDRVTITGDQIESGYQVTFNYKSESPMLLYQKDGRVTFTYDKNKHSWQLTGTKLKEEEWAFYDAGAVIDTVLTSLRCYINASEGDQNLIDNAFLTTISYSFEAKKTQIAYSALKFTVEEAATTSTTSEHAQTNEIVLPWW